MKAVPESESSLPCVMIVLVECFLYSYAGSAGTDGVPFSTCHIRIPTDNILFFINYEQLPGNLSARYPHGTELQARCVDIGKFTFHGNHNIACVNGEWSDKIPYCTPNQQKTGENGMIY